MTQVAGKGKARSGDDADGTLRAAQAALAAEHASVYGYGTLGGRLEGSRRRDATAASDAHRARRDALVRTVRDLGGTPVAARAAYALPFAVRDPASAMRLARCWRTGSRVCTPTSYAPPAARCGRTPRVPSGRRGARGALARHRRSLSRAHREGRPAGQHGGGRGHGGHALRSRSGITL